jgi:hypothetical protein
MGSTSHHHQRNTAPILAFVPGLAPFLLASTGAFGLTAVPRTPTGVGGGVTFATTFLELGLGGRWRGFAIDFDD